MRAEHGVRRHEHDADGGAARHGAEGGRARPARSPARPARPTTRTTPGSSASRPTSWPASGSASTPSARSARSETGGHAAAPIWTAFMKKALEGRPVVDFPVPEDVIFAQIDRATGLRAVPGSRRRARGLRARLRAARSTPPPSPSDEEARRSTTDAAAEDAPDRPTLRPSKSACPDGSGAATRRRGGPASGAAAAGDTGGALARTHRAPRPADCLRASTARARRGRGASTRSACRASPVAERQVVRRGRAGPRASRRRPRRWPRGRSRPRARRRCGRRRSPRRACGRRAPCARSPAGLTAMPPSGSRRSQSKPADTSTKSGANCAADRQRRPRRRRGRTPRRRSRAGTAG